MKSKKLSLNTYKLVKYKKILAKINDLSDIFARMTDEELQQQTPKLKQVLATEGKTTADVEVEAFATIREAAKRVLGLYPYDVQILGGLIMHDQQIAEMRTGEGKTLTAILPLYLHALTGKSTILVTSNEYLAQRDAEEMGKVFRFLGMTVGVAVTSDPKKKLKVQDKQRIYKSDIVYTTHSALGFDYLQENLAASKDKQFLPSFEFVVVDEIDAALLDSAQMPLIISGSPRVQSNLFLTCDEFVKTLKEEEEYKLDPTRSSVWLTYGGAVRAHAYFQVENLYDPDNHELNRQINLALRANFLMEKDKQYTVEDDEIKLMDESTGRVLEGNRLQSGLHQAIEAKERVKLTLETRSVASITYQNLFRMFPKLSGMTGTGKVCEDEFQEVYGLGVVVVPTHKPNIRKDYPDEIYLTMPQKIEASLQLVKELHAKGQPVLIATGTVGMSELYSMILLQEGIPHSVLNAYNSAKEAEMIAKAGQWGAVTVATSMAGRGTDILLGEGVKELGGLAVIGTERMSSQRTDLQLRGRAGRQGSPGMSKFFVSLEDELITKFGSTWVNDFYQKEIKKPEQRQRGRLSSGRIKRAVEEAQTVSDNAGTRSRKSAEEFDNSIKAQNKIVYQRRQDILNRDSFKRSYFEEILREVLDDVWETTPFRTTNDLFRFILDNVSYHCEDIPDQLRLTDKKQVVDYVMSVFLQEYRTKQEFFKEAKMFYQFQRIAVLKAVDDCWVEQVDYLQQFQQMVMSQGYAQKNPVNEFHKEAYRTYQRMNKDVKRQIIRNIALSHVSIGKKNDVQVAFG